MYTITATLRANKRILNKPTDVCSLFSVSHLYLSISVLYIPSCHPNTLRHRYRERLYTGYPWVFFSHALSNEPETILVLQRTSGFSLKCHFLCVGGSRAGWIRLTDACNVTGTV
jgi:hypothetical protein